MSRFTLKILIFVLIPIFIGASPPEIETLETGSPAPDFQLKGVDGNHYSLKSFQDATILVIIFTANHCPTAQAYEDRIIQLDQDYKNQGVQLVAISSNDPKALRLDEMGYTDLGDTFEDMQIRAKDKNFQFPYLYDGETQEMAKAYGPVATPHVFIFDQMRKLRYCGRIDNSEKPQNVTTSDTQAAIEALLAGNSVPNSKTKTFGCSIKWAEKREGVASADKNWQNLPVTVEKIDISGIQKIIKNASDKLRLINIWATWCGPCVTEFPELIKINRMYRQREFELITISADSPVKQEEVLTFLRKNYSATQNFLFNSEDKYALIEAVDKDWPGGIPYTLLVQPGGKIIYQHLGIIDPLEVKKMIVSYLGRYYK
jgi:thiol-disulfide isomerase/thioredoxin